MILELDTTDFPATLYKPTALDGFCEHSKFVPEMTGLPHGLTKPVDPAFKELVSAQVRYTSMGGGTATIRVTHVAW